MNFNAEDEKITLAMCSTDKQMGKAKKSICAENKQSKYRFVEHERGMKC